MNAPARAALLPCAPCAPALALALALAAPGAAHAQDTGGVYGRLRADTTLSVEAAGGVAVLRGGEARGLVTGALRFRYLESAGAFLSYQYAPGPTREDALALGVDLRPLMIARIFSDWEHGPRWLDLMTDSIGLEMGVAWARPGEKWREGSGLAWVFGGGMEFPLAWNEGTALMLRLAVRWTHSVDWDAQGPGRGAYGMDSVGITLGLVGRTMARLGLVGIH